ncbi:unnamed protein product, partial [Urochloa humidicola]
SPSVVLRDGRLTGPLAASTVVSLPGLHRPASTDSYGVEACCTCTFSTSCSSVLLTAVLLGLDGIPSCAGLVPLWIRDVISWGDALLLLLSLVPQLRLGGRDTQPHERHTRRPALADQRTTIIME